MDALIRDIRNGIRQLFRQRGSSLVAVLTLALGIGATTAVVSVIDATMLRPLPYPDPGQLVEVYVEQVETGGGSFQPTPSMEDMRTCQAADDVFSMVAASGGAFRGRITDVPEPVRIQVQHFTEDYLALHGVMPVLGRGFSRADTDPESPLVAMLGHGYWQSRFGGRDDAIGQTIRLDAETATIVGVLPSWFDAETPLATPLRIPARERSWRGTGRVTIYGRLRDGVTLEQARDRLTARLAGLPLPKGVREVRAVIQSRLESLASRSRTTVNVLAGAVGLILLIAAVNVAGLLLARGAGRQSELAVRAAIGAGRGRLIRQLLTESLVLALPAFVIGVLLARLSLDLIVANLPIRLPDNAPVTVNATVLLLTAAILAPTTLLFGLLPALRLSHVRIGSVLARGRTQVGTSLSRRGGQALMAAEIALAVILVAGAGLMIRSLLRIWAVDLGFTADGLVTMEVLPLDREAAARKVFYRALLDRLRTLPGVASAGIVDNFALGSGTSYTEVRAGAEAVFITQYQVLPGYFETIGARLRDGRLPNDGDYDSGFRGAVLSESAAAAMFPDGPAVGRRFEHDGLRGGGWTVLGVIADLRHRGPLNSRRAEHARQVFLPLEPREDDRLRAMTAIVRLSAAGPGIGGLLREAAQAVGPRVLIERIRTADEMFGELVITPRRQAALLGLLGALGLTLALVGVFGMTAYAVARRTGEIGVRMAFGARADQVVGTILRDSAPPIAAGVLFGVGGAVMTTRVIESFLFETAPRDPLTLAVVAVTLAAAGCLAALVPALRAVKVDPVACLRAE